MFRQCPTRASPDKFAHLRSEMHLESVRPSSLISALRTTQPELGSCLGKRGERALCRECRPASQPVRLSQHLPSSLLKGNQVPAHFPSELLRFPFLSTATTDCGPQDTIVAAKAAYHHFEPMVPTWTKSEHSTLPFELQLPVLPIQLQLPALSWLHPE